MSCCMCGTPDATVYWTIVPPLLRTPVERQVCNDCELKHRRARSKRATA